MTLNNKTTTKGIIIEFVVNAVFLLLLGSAFVFISLGMCCEGAIQSLLIGLGTGSATSFLVSFVFYYTDKLIKKRETLKIRGTFIDEFMLLLYRFTQSMNFSSENGKIGWKDYVKMQHRWFHNYYKRLIVDAGTDAETKERLDKLKDFIKEEEAFFKQTFELSSNWKHAGFSDNQLDKLRELYFLFERVIVSLKNESVRRSLLDFSSLLETVKSIPDTFKEFSSFSLINFEVSDGSLKIDYSEFEKHEPMFKFFKTSFANG